MAWGWFSIVLAVTFVIQTAAVQPLAPAWLDFLLVLALVYALSVPAAEARLAGWMTGFAQDVGGSGPPGLHALALGLAALILTWLRGQVNMELWWGRWLIALVAAFPARLLVGVHERVLQGANVSWGALVGRSLTAALVAGLLATGVFALPRVLGRRWRRRSIPRW